MRLAMLRFTTRTVYTHTATHTLPCLPPRVHTPPLLGRIPPDVAATHATCVTRDAYGVTVTVCVPFFCLPVDWFRCTGRCRSILPTMPVTTPLAHHVRHPPHTTLYRLYNWTV